MIRAISLLRRVSGLLLLLALGLLALLVASCDSSPVPPPTTPSPAPGTVRVWFSATLTEQTTEPAAALRLVADIPDPQPGRTGPRPLPFVYFELLDAAGGPAVFGPGPVPPQPMFLRGQPAMWSADASAPTAPGRYHVRLTVQVAGAPTQTLDLPTPLLTVITPTHALQSGFLYDRDGNLWLTSTDGTRTRKLTFYPRPERASEPAWSPDGQRIAYSRTLPGPADQLPVSEIWSVRADGTDAHQLVARRADEDLLYPAWTPDGRLLLTVDRVIDPLTGATPTSARLADGRESWTVEAVDTATSVRHVVLTDALMADMSRDGQQIVYVASTPARSESEQIPVRTLMIARADGSNPRVLVPVNHYQDVRTPRFSPDGQQITFSTVNPDGWSPVLRRVFPHTLRAALNGVPWDVYLIPAAGSTPRRLTQLQADLPTAAWTDAANSLAVLTDRGLYNVPLDGSAPRLLAPGALHSILSWYGP